MAVRTRRRLRDRAGASAAAQPASETASTAADAGQEVASAAAEEGQEVASVAADEGQQVVESARQSAQEVAGTAREEVSELSDEVVSEGRGLVEETRSQLEEQAQTQVEDLSQSVRRLGTQARALAEGRPSQAGPLPSYLIDASDRLEQLADDVDARGVEGLLQDLQSFARRRPGVFLLGALAAGFGVGRLVRAQSSDDSEGEPAAARATTRGRAAPAAPAQGQLGRPPRSR